MFTTRGDHQILQCPPRPLVMDRKWKSSFEHAPNCPRCASSNTKFCYYNNYSLSQPRYFCKGCRRYWTKGGSLRNVPVGGGCRKNRRSKSVRLAHTQGSSVSYSRSFDSNPNEPFGNSCSTGRDSMVQENGNSGSDIDLAVVFAKFLNQNSSFEPEFVGSELPNEVNATFELSNSLTADSVQSTDTVIESHKPSDLIGDADLLQEIELPHVLVGEKQQEEERIQEFMDHDTNAFGMQTLLGDEVVQDVLWSEAATLPNFTWQPMVQLQEFETLQSDDPLKISANLISDGWSSFDLSGFEVFSRP